MKSSLLCRLKKPSVKSFILDCEVVAFDREKKKILPFQILSTRARKNVNVNDIKVGVCIFAFDMLYLNGQQLIQENLDIRREVWANKSFFFPLVSWSKVLCLLAEAIRIIWGRSWIFPVCNCSNIQRYRWNTKVSWRFCWHWVIYLTPSCLLVGSFCHLYMFFFAGVKG